MGSNWKPIPENLTPEELAQYLPRLLNQWAVDKDRFESSVSTPRTKRSAGSSIALTREQTVDITRVGDLAGVSGSIADEPFITVNNTAGLNAERQLLVADPLNKTDAGANSNLSLGVSYSTPAIVLGAAAAEGSAARPIRSDSTIAAFDATTPSGISTSSAAGTNAFASRSDHTHSGGDRLTSANSTLVLTDDGAGTSQTLTGDYGDLHVTGQSAIVLNSNAVSGSTWAAFTLNDVSGNGAGGDRSTGRLFQIVNETGVGNYVSTETALSLTAEAAPKLMVHLPGTGGGARVAYMDVNNAAWGQLISATGAITGTPNLKMTSSGGQTSWKSLQARFLFDNGSAATSDPNIRFFISSQGHTNPVIKFEHTKLENVASTVPMFWFDKVVGFSGSGNFLECTVNGTTGFALNQDMRPMLKDINGATFTVIGASSSNTADKTLWIDLEDADRYAVTTPSDFDGVAADSVPRFISASKPSVSGSNVKIASTVDMDRLDLQASDGNAASLRMPVASVAPNPLILNDGDYYQHPSQACEVAHYGTDRYHTGGLYVSTATATADAAAEETLIGSGVGSLTLPANFFVVGRSIMVTAYGTAVNTDIPGQTITVRLKVGATTVASIVNQTPVPDAEWHYRAMITCRSTGASGTIITNAAQWLATSTTLSSSNVTTDRTYDADATSVDELADVLGTVFGDLDRSANYSGSSNQSTDTINTGSSLAIAMTGEWNNITGSPVLHCTHFMVKVAF